MEKILCLYHGRCLDGFASAWVVGKHFGFENVEFIPCDYDTPIPVSLKGRTVYIVDFSYVPEVLLPAAQEAEFVTIIDHHETMLKHWGHIMLEGGVKNMALKYSGTHAGSVATWDHFWNPSDKPIFSSPLLLRICEDYDLHNFVYEDTREIAAALYAKPMIARQDFQAFDNMLTAIKSPRDVMYRALVAEGIAILGYQKSLVEEMMARSMRFIRFAGYDRIPCMAVPRELRTLAGSMMAKGFPFSIGYEDYKDGVREYSLRSDKSDPQAANVRLICEKVGGGGGHKNAAGFRLPYDANKNLLPF